MRRLRARWMLLPALAAVIVLVVPQAASPNRLEPKHPERQAKHVKKAKVDRAALARKAAHLRGEISWHRRNTWRWQDAAGVPRTKSSKAERQTAGVAYLSWMVRLWSSRREHAKAYAARVERQWGQMNRDFETAVRILAHRLSLDSIAGWVLSCADSEGGRGAWVPNHSGSGAGGWMQFLSGTYYSNSPAAWEFARSRHVVVPREYDSWYSPVGQALTALHMFHHEGSGQWTGAGC